MNKIQYAELERATPLIKDIYVQFTVLYQQEGYKLDTPKCALFRKVYKVLLSLAERFLAEIQGGDKHQAVYYGNLFYQWLAYTKSVANSYSEDPYRQPKNWKEIN